MIKKKIIFTGTGTTGAINNLVHKINFAKYKNVYIFTSMFEHHSNFLPWKEFEREHSNVHVKLLNFSDNPIKEINILGNDTNNLIIVSMSGCSNVTGHYFTTECDTMWNHIKTMKKNKINAYLLIDYACCAPYMQIDGSKCDGFFFSGHKFLGGQQTPGCLVVTQELLQTRCPYAPGGGCVVRGDDQNITYKDDIETRETGGTPNIIGIIRLRYVLELQKILFEHINHNENIIRTFCNKKMNYLAGKYSHFSVMFMKQRASNDLPIYPVTISGMHYNLLTVLLNDLFGIQTRGGISCCGVLGRIADEKLHIDGWCRITFSYLLKKEEIHAIFYALEYILNKSNLHIHKYVYNKEKNQYENVKK